MLLYEYQCHCCHSVFEYRKAVEERQTAVCPHCNGIGDKRPSLFGYTFGWRLSDESHLAGHKDELVKDI
jgi:putative FmdB family regulatory protein